MSTKDSAPAGKTEDVTAPPIAGGGTAPMGGQGSPMPGQDEPVNVKTLSEAQPAYDKAKAAFLKAPTDAKAKEAYISATNTLADSTMMAADLGPKKQYPGALKLYREVLKTDASNKHADVESKLIIGIYKSMGRPVPAEGG